MKLLPRTGIDGLRFGATIAECVRTYGQPHDRRVHPDRAHPSIHLDYADADLTLGFTIDEHLQFIVVGRKNAGVELWGAFPFPFINAAEDRFAAARSWIESRGHKPSAHSDSLGDYLRVESEGVVFCFSTEDPGLLDGIQLVPVPGG